MRKTKGTNDAPSADSLRKTLTELDQITQGRTEQIGALARAAALCIATGNRQALKDAGTLLFMIEAEGETLCNDVNYSAEQQGCNYVGPETQAEGRA